MPSPINRRDVIRLFSAAAFAAPLALAAPDPGAPLFFTKDEFVLLDTLTELIIPADDHSPGAHGAGVAAYIDKTVAEAFVPGDKTSWQQGLAAVNGLSQSLNGVSFLKASKEQQNAVLTKMSSQNNKGKTEPEKFFGQLKNTTIFAYYTTSIGIHQEMEYKGNVILDKFVGYLPSDTLPPLSSL